MADGWTTGVDAAAQAAANVPAEDIKGTPEWFAKRDRLIVSWQQSKAIAEAAKNDEREQRQAVVDFVFPVAERKAGMNNHDLGNGYTLKFGNTIGYSFGDHSNEAIERVMDEIEKVGNVGAVLVDRLVKTKYEPSMTEYKALGDTNDEQAIKKLFDSIFTTKPGAPALEVKEPKATLRG